LFWLQKYHTFGNKWLQIEILYINRYNFEISRKGTTGNLYQIVSNHLYQLFWPRTVKFSKTDTIIIDINIVITKINMIISEIEIIYVYNLAHAWLNEVVVYGNEWYILFILVKYNVDGIFKIKWDWMRANNIYSIRTRVNV
jgi:hypothetical protein